MSEGGSLLTVDSASLTLNGQANSEPATAGRTVYLDHQATTPVDECVLDAMLPYFREHFGNPSSGQHLFGRRAADAVDDSREQVANLIGARTQEIVFTSGATESNNLAIKGAAFGSLGPRRIVTSPTEHKSVLDPLHILERDGFEVVFLPVDTTGLIDIEALDFALQAPTLMVSVMAANNEIGTIAPVREIGQRVRAAGALFHCDATQLVGKCPVDVDEMNIDLLSLSAHKMYGPKGVGALYVRHEIRSRVIALVDGGGHERGLRSGTLNVTGCVGLGAACELSRTGMEADAARMQTLARALRCNILRALPDVRQNGHPEQRLPGNLNLCFPGVDAEDLMLSMPDVALSSGSACTSASPEPSHVLRAIGLNYEDAQSSVRIGIGRFTTPQDVEFAAGRIVEQVLLLRDLTMQGERASAMANQ